MLLIRTHCSIRWLRSGRPWFVALLLSIGLASVWRVAATGCLQPAAGLVGWWTGDGHANDIAGANSGVLQGGATATASGLVGFAFGFDGTNNYVQIPDSPVLRPMNLTLEAWVLFDSLDSSGFGASPPGQQYIVFKRNSSSTNTESFLLGKTRVTDGDVFVFTVSSAAGEAAEVESTTRIATGAWFHVAGVRGSNFIQLYVNGQLESETNVNFPQDYGDFPLYFGTSGQSEWDHKFNGRLDEVSLYDYALSSNGISAIWAAGVAGKCKEASIVLQPRGQTVLKGTNASFEVVASGLGPLSYQWRFNGESIADATSSNLTLTNVEPGIAGDYTVVVTNSLGSATSTVAVLTVLVPPIVTVQPQSRTNVGNTIAVFTAAATGLEPLSYRWYRDGLSLVDGGRISGASSSSLTIADVRLGDAANYALVASNANGIATSDIATLTVTVPEVVVIPDGNLEAAIRSALNTPMAPLNTEDLAMLTNSLFVCNRGVLNLSGLEWATNLASLSLSGNLITNLSPLEGLRSLVRLSLDANRLSDISALASLPMLKNLNAAGNQITDPSAITGLTNLYSLRLSGNPISDLSFVSDLTRLRSLELEDNQIIDLAPLTALTNLSSLALGGNPISSVSPISGLLMLTNLSLRNDGIDTLCVLSNLNRLVSLDLERNRIADLAPLAGSTDLKFLNLGWNSVTNYAAVLSDLTNLTTLYFGGNSISNIDFVQSLSRLTFLNLNENAIRDLSPITSLTNLSYLVLSGNPITNHPLLSNLTGIVNLELRGDSISNLTFLSSLNRLSYLDIAYNHITDLLPLVQLTNVNAVVLDGNRGMAYTGLSGMGSLSNLWLNGNSISNVTFLTHMTQLKCLSLGDNCITSLSSLGGLTNLVSLYADLNRLTNIDALTNLPQLSSLGVAGNLLVLSNASQAMTNIHILQNRGVKLTYLPQNDPPSIFIPTNWIIAANATSSQFFSAFDDFTPHDQLLVTTHSSNPALIPDENIQVDTADYAYALRITPATNQIGLATINLTVTDAAGLMANADVYVTVQVATNISILDPSLEAVLCQILQKPSGTLNTVELQSLTELYLDDPEIMNLSGLEWATRLEVLYLAGNSVTNLDVVQNLTRLKSLSLYDNPINDYSPLAALTNLTTLVVKGNSLGTLTFLQDMVQITDLGLFDTDITDFASLAGLTNLTSLNLVGNSISNLSFLETQYQLTNLALVNCRLADVTPLAALTHLNSLDLRQNRLTDISPLTNLLNLSFIDLRQNLLETSTNSVLDYLRNQGVLVLYQPQRSPPALVTPSDGWFVVTNAISYARFSVFDTGPTNRNLAITASSSDTNLASNTHLIVSHDANGRPEDWILTVLPPADYAGTTTITLIALNDVSMSATSTVQLTIFIPLPVDDQVVGGSNQSWLTGGASSWLGQTNVTHDGVSAAQSGSILDNEESWLATSVTGPGILSFWWKVSSESGYDWLEFYVNDVLQTNQISGQTDWSQVTVSIPPGLQTIKWRYVKDAGWSSGFDAAWLDEVGYRAEARVTLGDLSQVYHGTAKYASATTEPDGLAVSLTYNGSASAPTNAGSYVVIGTVENPFYLGSATNILIIAQATLTATADNKSRAYGQANPPFTISYAGFVGGDDTNDLNSLPTASTIATSVSPAGTYNIALAGGADENYAFNLFSGTLTITNRPPLISFVTVTNGVAVLTWSATAGQLYRLQYKDEPTSADWSDLFPEVLAIGPTATGTIVVENVARRFYRVLVVP